MTEKTWGGSRSGAGRKNRGLDLVHRAFRLRREDADTIKQISMWTTTGRHSKRRVRRPSSLHLISSA